MKKKYTFGLLLILLGSGACTKLQDIAPLANYTDKTVWSLKSDVQAALNGCYKDWEPSGASLLLRDCFTDNLVNRNISTIYEPFTSGTYNPLVTYVVGGLTGIFDYTVINNCNWFLEHIDGVKAGIIDTDYLKRTKAEVRFLRAYRYFMLAQFFRNVPLILHTQTIEESRVQPQVSKETTTNFVLAELAAIAADLPVEYTDYSEKGHITRGAALALKARIELYTKKYDDCIATCNQLMTAPFNYSLYADYEDMFRPQFESSSMNKEVILDAQYMSTYYPKSTLADLAIFPAGNSNVCVTQSLVDAFETMNGLTIDLDASYDPQQPYQNRDPRLDATVIRPGLLYNGILFDPITPPAPPSGGGIGGGPIIVGGSGPIPAGGGSGNGNGYPLLPGNYKGDSFNSPTGYNMKKYLKVLNDYWQTSYGLNQLNNTGGNVIVIRYAEVLLTYAEAKIEAGQIDQSVYEAINKVRRRVFMPEVNTGTHSGQTAMRDLVRRERRVELAGEGLRWFDIVRWQIGPGVIKDVYDCPNGAKVPGPMPWDPPMFVFTPNSNTVKFSRTFTPKYYVFPIPPEQLQLNTKLVQNPEWK
ncbi:RagB/SusD family nutrient uptake outer membrane protein [Pedobacter borealis]|uniref:RagB/SusD family nutrient uptake outer membrane protein n=1 Tax=Pedobacter borealis TaxID=475254 RepID=UPI0006911C87|nr:RagB/SusD family nutrient uptake outer membrane protein [Pedobacter borealis]